MTDSSDSIDPAVIERAREAALRLLDRRRRTRKELDDKLRQAGHDPESRRAALDRLARVGLVDDLEYARAFLRERLPKRAVGDRRIKQALSQRGVSPDAIAAALREVQSAGGAAGASGAADATDAIGVTGSPGGIGGAVDERARAERALRELLRKYASLDGDVRRRRVVAALARRGFSYALVREILDANAPS